FPAGAPPSPDDDQEATRRTMMKKVAEWELKREIAAGHKIPMTDRWLVAEVNGFDERLNANMSERVLSQMLTDYHRRGIPVHLFSRDPLGRNAATVAPLPVTQFFRGSDSEFKLAVLKRYKELVRSERDPLSPENITEVLDAVQLGLDILGMLPIIGKPFDLASGVISAGRGDYLGASITFAALLTTVGGAGVAAVIARRAADAVETGADVAKAARVTGNAAELVREVQALGDIESQVAKAAKQVSLDIDNAI